MSDAIRSGGMDWMISCVNWQSRHTPEKGNHFTVCAEIPAGTMDYESFRTRLAAKCRNILPLLNGHWSHIPFRPPVWRTAEGSAPGTELLPEGVDAMRDFMTRPLSGSFVCAFQPAGERIRLLFKFSHALFDGGGAERFIASFLSGDAPFDAADGQPVPVPARTVRESGNLLGRRMMSLLREKIALPPRAERTGIRLEFLRIGAEESRALASEVERIYGPFSYSLFVLAVILTEAEQLLSELGVRGDTMMIPMSVDMRQRTNAPDALFFNHWSILPLTVRRADLRAGIAEALKAVRRAYMKELSGHAQDLFRNASEAMLFLPFRAIALFNRISPGATSGTMMFSFLETAASPDILDLFHAPVMPAVNPMGFFVNRYRDALNITVSCRSGILPEARAAQLKESLLRRLSVSAVRGDRSGR